MLLTLLWAAGTRLTHYGGGFTQRPHTHPAPKGHCVAEALSDTEEKKKKELFH